MSRKKFAVIGLTGPTGSGKSSVAQMFESCGCSIIDADITAREAVKKGSVCLKQLCCAFGDDILDSSGELKRRELAMRAFSSKEGTHILNTITHPHIIMLTMIKIKELINAGKSLIVFDAPTLFESNSDVLCDYITAVIAPKELRLQRILQRDGIDFEHAAARINAQHEDKFYTEQSDFIITNDKDRNALKDAVSSIVDAVKADLL